ncbi:MAG TPA: hypothetical protein PKY30_05185, partial [Myxococcota bacterium]|nr:hypothetical protein [Myxococcota bacterium]
YYLCMQFILGQSGQRAPVHIPAEATLNCSDIWGMSYRPAAAPNADTWPDWLRDHHNFYMTSGTRWPMCGFTFTGTYTNSRSLDLDEYLELPKGDYSLQLGFSTNGSQSHGAVTLQNLALRAVILPV